jgi:predicted nucleic acid-binding Zn ribbon protein
MAHSSAPAAPLREAPEPTHACIRCGKPGLPPERALCEECNPLELAQPSATQLHGIAAFGIIVFVAILAVLGRWTLSGTGPFVGSVTGVSATATGLAVTVMVENQGKKAGATTCRIVAAGNPVGGQGELVQTPLIQPASSVQFTSVITKLGTDPVALDADCQSP